MSTLSQSVISNSLILGGLKIIQKSIGLISTIILARILTPTDFGLVSIVLIFVFLAESLGDSGATYYLIQKKHILREDINTAYTINFITKSFLYILLVIAAPYISLFYENKELTLAIWVVSSVLIIKAFANPGMILLKKELNFKKIAMVQLIVKFISFFGVITLAILYENYWALIFGDLLSATLFVFGSYIIHEYRPSFSIKKIREQFVFSQWMFVSNLVGFLRAQIDRILIPKFYGIDLAGQFHLTRHISSIPSQDLLIPAIEPLMSSFSIAKEDKKRFIFQFETSLIFAVSIVFPIGSILYFYSDVIVLILLGNQWKEAAPILQSLAFLSSVAVVGKIISTGCLAMNLPKVLFYYNASSLVFILSGLIYFSYLEISQFAAVRIILESLFLIGFLWYLRKKFELSFIRVLSEIVILLLIAILSGWLINKGLHVQNLGVFNGLLGAILTLILYFIIILFIHLSVYNKTERGKLLTGLFISNISKLKKKLRRN